MKWLFFCDTIALEVRIMYYKRKIDDYLDAWKADPEHKPLIVKGARQIGKTESVLHFAKANYANIVYINFALEKRYAQIVADGYDVTSVIKNISLVNPALKFVPNDTIIIFDEIQDNPDVATTLKAFKMDGRYDVICSGSMLGINYKKIHSNSVGAKTDYEMYSMDFEEFLWAKGYNDTQIDSILDHMTSCKPFNDNELSIFKNLFLDFCVLGGMPDVVKAYMETGTFSGTLAIQEQIRLDYEEDVRKYAWGLDQSKIISVYRSIPAQLAKENKKFQFNKVAKNARSREYTGCIEWLKDAGVVIPTYNIESPKMPLLLNKQHNLFKLFMNDVGLLTSMYGSSVRQQLLTNYIHINWGAIHENMVAQELVAHGYTVDDSLFYFNSKKQGELDFVIEHNGQVLPIEVKSGKDYERHNALSGVMKNVDYNIPQSVVFCQGNVRVKDSIIYLPIYMTMFLEHEHDEDFFYKFDPPKL